MFFLEKRHPKTLALQTQTHTLVQATDISDKLHPVELCNVTSATCTYVTHVIWNNFDVFVMPSVVGCVIFQ